MEGTFAWKPDKQVSKEFINSLKNAGASSVEIAINCENIFIKVIYKKRFFSKKVAEEYKFVKNKWINVLNNIECEKLLSFKLNKIKSRLIRHKIYFDRANELENNYKLDFVKYLL